VRRNTSALYREKQVWGGMHWEKWVIPKVDDLQLFTPVFESSCEGVLFVHPSIAVEVAFDRVIRLLFFTVLSSSRRLIFLFRLSI